MRNLRTDAREELHQTARVRNRDRAWIEARLLPHETRDQRRIEPLRPCGAGELRAVDDGKQNTVDAHVSMTGIGETLRDEDPTRRLAVRNERVRRCKRAID